MTPEELAYFRQQARKKCISETNEDYADFINDSNSTMLGFRRDANEWDLKHTIGTAVARTHKIYVWKRSSSAVYFRIRTSEATPKNIYLKFSTTANRDLMRQVQEDGCAQDAYETSTVNSGTVTLKKDDKNFTTNNADTKFKIFRTFSLSSSQPGFYGFLQFKYTKQYYNNDGDTVSSPAAEKELFEAKSVTATEQNSDTYTSNTDYPNRYYCLVADYTAAQIDVLTLSNLNCDNSSDTVTVNQGSETFTPATELTNPNSISL